MEYNLGGGGLANGSRRRILRRLVARDSNPHEPAHREPVRDFQMTKGRVPSLVGGTRLQEKPDDKHPIANRNHSAGAWWL